MIPPPCQQCGQDDTANSRGSGRKALRLWLGLVALTALAALAFVGYQQPEMLLNYVNLRYCG